jgi:integrase
MAEREEAIRLRRLARAGGDPLAIRRPERRAVPIFREAATTVHVAHATTFRNARHRAQWIASLEAGALPLSGGRPVDGITEVLPRARQASVHHAALPYAEVPTFVQVLREAKAGEATRLGFEFLILTAARTSEVVGARWEEIDLARQTWTIPASRIKAGREHRVPLSPRCSELLDRAKAIADGGPFVSPGRTAEVPLSNMVLLMLLRRLGHDDITAHGFRGVFRDWAAERTNSARAVCEAALAHVVKDKAEAAYFRSDLFDQRRRLMKSWSVFATTKLAKVVAFPA